jgi:sulfate-transporting ATPase
LNGLTNLLHLTLFVTGAGKSTLIKMITGKDQPDSGEIKIGETVQIVSVGQERMDELDAEKTVFEEISEGLDEIELGTQSINSRAYLSWFGFKGQSQQAKVNYEQIGECRQLHYQWTLFNSPPLTPSPPLLRLEI